MVYRNPHFCLCLGDTYIHHHHVFQRSVDDRMTSSFLVQAASVLALCQLTPVIINLDMSRIFVMLETLTTWLPGQSDAPEAPVLQLAYGLGLGGVLGKLFEENFMDTCSSKVINIHKPWL